MRAIAGADCLTVAGLLYDILGACILGRGLIWAAPRTMGEQAIGLSWSGNADLLRALSEQKTDARWGASLLTFGFLLQAASAAGLKPNAWPVLPILAALIVLIGVTYCLSRPALVRKFYIGAVNASNAEEDDKEIMRNAFDKAQSR